MENKMAASRCFKTIQSVRRLHFAQHLKLIFIFIQALIKARGRAVMSFIPELHSRVWTEMRVHVKTALHIFNDICVDFYGRERSASSPTVPAVPSVSVMRGFGESASLLSFSIMLVIIFNSYTQWLCAGKIYVSLWLADLESREGKRAESMQANTTAFLSNLHITRTPFGQPPDLVCVRSYTRFCLMCQDGRGGNEIGLAASWSKLPERKSVVPSDCVFDSCPDFCPVMRAGTDTRAAGRNGSKWKFNLQSGMPLRIPGWNYTLLT